MCSVVLFDEGSSPEDDGYEPECIDEDRVFREELGGAEEAFVGKGGVGECVVGLRSEGDVSECVAVSDGDSTHGGMPGECEAAEGLVAEGETAEGGEGDGEAATGEGADGTTAEGDDADGAAADGDGCDGGGTEGEEEAERTFTDGDPGFDRLEASIGVVEADMDEGKTEECDGRAVFVGGG